MEWWLVAITISKSIFIVLLKVNFRNDEKGFFFFFSSNFFVKKQQNMSKKNYQVDESPSIKCNLFKISVHVPKGT
jgi:hypothetical protein